MSDAPKYLRTLRRIPVDVFLATLGHEILMTDTRCCVLGWAFREALSLERNQSAESIFDFGADYTVCNGLRRRYGGSYDEWIQVYGATADARQVVLERAVVTRLDEIVWPESSR